MLIWRFPGLFRLPSLRALLNNLGTPLSTLLSPSLLLLVEPNPSSKEGGLLVCLPLTPLPPACSSCVYAACPGARLPFRVHLHLHLNRGTPRTSVCLPPLPCSAFGFQYLQGSRGGGNCCAFIPLRGWLPFACGCPASPRAPVASSLLPCCSGCVRIHHPV